MGGKGAPPPRGPRHVLPRRCECGYGCGHIDGQARDCQGQYPVDRVGQGKQSTGSNGRFHHVVQTAQHADQCARHVQVHMYEQMPHRGGRSFGECPAFCTVDRENKDLCSRPAVQLLAAALTPTYFPARIWDPHRCGARQCTGLRTLELPSKPPMRSRRAKKPRPMSRGAARQHCCVH
jgi:hypothetical protein